MKTTLQAPLCGNCGTRTLPMTCLLGMISRTMQVGHWHFWSRWTTPMQGYGCCSQVQCATVLLQHISLPNTQSAGIEKPIPPRYTNRTMERECACNDVTPPTEIYNCTLQRQFGRCNETWMIEVWPPLCDALEGDGGYCARSCGRCSCPGDPPLPPLLDDKVKMAMMKEQMRMHALGLSTGQGWLVSNGGKQTRHNGVPEGGAEGDDRLVGGVPEYWLAEGGGGEGSSSTDNVGAQEHAAS